ncbi:large ribosomal subunit protein mL62 isoform X2 [Planococcus citri]|uniref:large ribosomal subunit protein mL62 isoform X2 n=1 Tax=Planococcus citri TaxID=170843 RepID=UPI0031F723D1
MTESSKFSFKITLVILNKFSIKLLNAMFLCIYFERTTEYSSAHSLKNLYPESSLKITTPNESSVVEKCSQVYSGYIPLDKITFKYSRSQGPGGQNRDHTYSKVQLRVKLSDADWIPENVRLKLLEMKKNQLSKDGYFIIKSDKTRSQQLNRADVMQRLRCIIYHAVEQSTSTEPSPETIDKIRKRQEKANRERLQSKRLRSLIKENRRIVE